MNNRYVEKPIAAIPEVEEQLMEKPPMDFHTKVVGSKNTLVQKNQERLSWQRRKRDSSINNRNLKAIEQDAVDLMTQERMVNLDRKFIEQMRRVFN